MNDQNLVNKPMKAEQIIQALRCTSAPGGPIEDCEKCPFWQKENLTPEQAKQLGTDNWASCDIDRVGMAAADRLANDQRHIAALQAEINALQKRLELSNAERDANTQRMIELEQGEKWIPVTDDFPEQMMKLSPSADVMRTAHPRIGGAVLCFCKDGTKNVMRYDFNANAWVLRILSHMFYFEPIFVTYWCPLPEPPEEV